MSFSKGKGKNCKGREIMETAPLRKCHSGSVCVLEKEDGDAGGFEECRGQKGLVDGS